jgi:hypothetical protein
MQQLLFRPWFGRQNLVSKQHKYHQQQVLYITIQGKGKVVPVL